MGDIADILGLSSNNNHKDGLSQEASKILGTSESMKSKNSSKLVKKPKGMSREVFSLLGQDNLTSSLQPQLTIQQSNTFKSKRSAISSGKWVWSEVFESSSNRTRNYPKIYHWMKSDLQNIEYPYLKFDVQLDRVTFTHEEYETLLRSEKWTESESEYLLDLCYTYELRWPVILDRYSLQPPRRTEELQHRFYSILSSLQSYRGSSSLGRGESFTHFNIEVERNRRIQQELVFYKTKDELVEENNMREELKAVENAMKKYKKTTNSSAPSSSLNSQIELDVSTQEQQSINSMLSMVGKPALQSSRLISAAYTTTLSKTLLKKLSCLLKDLGLPEKPLPTKRVCDLYEQVHRQGVALLTLQTMISKREKEIANLKASLNTDDSSELKFPNSVLTMKIPPPSSRSTASGSNTHPYHGHQPQPLATSVQHALSSMPTDQATLQSAGIALGVAAKKTASAFRSKNQYGAPHDKVGKRKKGPDSSAAEAPNSVAAAFPSSVELLYGSHAGTQLGAVLPGPGEQPRAAKKARKSV